MTTKNWIRTILAFAALFLLTYVMWSTITYAEGREIINTKDYIEKLIVQEEQMKQLWEEENARCTENLDYYHTQAIYLRATIEEEQVKLQEKLGLNKQR